MASSVFSITRNEEEGEQSPADAEDVVSFEATTDQTDDGNNDEVLAAEEPKSSRRAVARRGRLRGRPGARSGAVGRPRKHLNGRRFTRAAATSVKTKKGSRGASPNVALLDMLAEVASATLKNDPTIKTSKRSPNKMVAEAQKSKVPTAADQLSLDQIRLLSDKLLLNMFAELSADEIRRNYSYRCYLMPDKCQKHYTSFGNENKARAQMKIHLLSHIATLLTEAKAAGKQPSNNFVAESVTCRKRRIESQQTTTVEGRAKVASRRTSSGQASATKSREAGGGGGGGKTRYTQIRPPRQSGRGRRGGAAANSRYRNLKGPQRPPSPESDSPEEREEDEMMDAHVVGEEDEGEHTELQEIVIEAVDEAWNPDEIEMQAIELQMETPEEVSPNHPMHDHCYTSVEGRRRTPEPQYYAQDGDARDDGSILVQLQEAVCDEEEEQAARQLTEEQNDDQQDDDLQPPPPINSCWYSDDPPTGISVYEVSPNQRPKVVRLRSPRQEGCHLWNILEDEITQDVNSSNRGSPEWERSIALKCIRQLRTKKKDTRVELMCRICPSQPKFTAQATLMYHYRSHAGIKPFVCTICETTFTRQHSLNYHMLIHNNKSRFTCKECGREFRHPSHFKEHLRRHTGETPFECSECGIRFKTRNTYKRHLKTRHGKLLTVNGIVDLSLEEFNKVRTKPKRSNARDVSASWPPKGATAKCIAAEAAAEAEIAATSTSQEETYQFDQSEEIDQLDEEMGDECNTTVTRDVGIGVMEDNDPDFEETGQEEGGGETEYESQSVVTLQSVDGATQMLEELSRVAAQTRHQLGDVMIQAYVINMEDGTTQIGLYPQGMYDSAMGTPIDLPDSQVQIKIEREDDEQHEQEECDDETEPEMMDGTSILGLDHGEVAEQEEDDGVDENGSAVHWINVNNAGFDEDSETNMLMHAIVP